MYRSKKSLSKIPGQLTSESLNKIRTISSKKSSLAPKDSLTLSIKPQKHRRLKAKTRNFTIKESVIKDSGSRDTSTNKILVFNKTSQLSSGKSRHKRAGTTLINSTLKAPDSVPSFSKQKKLVRKEIQKLKISKDIMKRLKRRSINYENDKLRGFSVDKSRASLLDTQVVIDGNSSNYVTNIFKKSKLSKDCPLPISSTSKKLKKAIHERFSTKNNI